MRILFNLYDDVTGGSDEVETSAESQAPMSSPGGEAASDKPEAIEPKPLKISATEWPMTHFHENALIPKGAAENESEGTVPTEILQRLNSPLPGKRADLSKEHDWLYRLVLGQYGAVSPATRKLAAARHALVKAAINAADNGCPPPRIGANEIARGDLARMDAPARREREIADLEAAIKDGENDTGFWLRMVLVPGRPLPKGVEWLLVQWDIQIGIGCLREALASYQLMHLRNWGIIYPKERLAEIRDEHGRGAAPDKIKVLNDEAQALSVQTMDSTSRAMRVTLQNKWQEVVEAVDLLASFCVSTLETERDAYIEAGKNTCAAHPMGVEYRPSALSGAFQPLIDQFKAHMAPRQKAHHIPNLTGPQPMDANNTILQSIFALPILDKALPPGFGLDENGDMSAEKMAQLVPGIKQLQ